MMSDLAARVARAAAWFGAISLLTLPQSSYILDDRSLEERKWTGKTCVARLRGGKDRILGRELARLGLEGRLSRIREEEEAERRLTDIDDTMRTKNVELVRSLLTNPKYTHYLNGFGLYPTPLLMAVNQNNSQLVRLVLALGAEPNVQSDIVRTSPLLLALSHRNLDIVRILLDAGANPNLCASNGDSPALIAVGNGLMDALQLLIKHSADLTIQRNDGATPIHMAARWGLGEILKMLIHEGVDVNSEDFTGNTPLIAAVHCRHFEACEILLTIEECNVDAVSDDGDTALTAAVSTGDSRLISAILAGLRSRSNSDIKYSHSRSALHMGVSKCNSDITRLLVSQGLDINIQDAKGRLPVQIASSFSHSAEILKTVIELGADVNKEGVHVEKNETARVTALYVATKYHHIDGIRLLLEAGADVNSSSNPENETALHVACRKKNMRSVRILVEAGADLEARDIDGCTPLFLCAERDFPEGLLLLIEHGANVDCLAKLDNYMLETSLPEGIVFDARQSALSAAIMQCNAEVTTMLIRAGADPLIPNVFNATAWMNAILVGNLEIIKILVEEGGVHPSTAFPPLLPPYTLPEEYLSQFGWGSNLVQNQERQEELQKWDTQQKGLPVYHLGQLNPFSELYDEFKEGLRKFDEPVFGWMAKRGTTALHIASESGYTDVVEYLLSLGANNVHFDLLLEALDPVEMTSIFVSRQNILIHAKTEHGTRPLHLACKEGHLQVVKTLIDSGAHINKGDIFGFTPLIWATKEQKLDVAKYLIVMGADINKVSRLRWPPLLFAASSANIPAIQMLMKAGANTTIHDYENNTAASILKKFSNLDLWEVSKDEFPWWELEKKAYLDNPWEVLREKVWDGYMRSLKKKDPLRKNSKGQKKEVRYFGTTSSDTDENPYSRPYFHPEFVKPFADEPEEFSFQIPPPNNSRFAAWQPEVEELPPGMLKLEYDPYGHHKDDPNFMVEPPVDQNDFYSDSSISPLPDPPYMEYMTEEDKYVYKVSEAGELEEGIYQLRIKQREQEARKQQKLSLNHRQTGKTQGRKKKKKIGRKEHI